MEESDELSDISSNDGSSNEGSVKSVTEEEIICSSSADDDNETDLLDTGVMQLEQDNTTDEPNWVKIDGYKANFFKFEAFVTDDLVDLIVEQSNLFAVQYRKNNIIKDRSRVQKWIPLVRNDIRLYIAFILYRGILWKPTHAMYFSTNPLFDTPLIRKVLSFDRFCLIEKFLHIVDNNESQLLWKSHLSWKQYIPSKRSRFGMKSFALCESATGYIWNCFLYTGKEMTESFAPDLKKYKYQATKIVITLMDYLIGNGYCLHIDNWYTSYEICKVLLDHNTDCIDTLLRYDTKTNIMYTKWRDKKDVHMLSTCVQNDTITVNKAGREKNIPIVIHEYNKNMGGDDRSD
ncbi:piggyBac transposable element-derived protein 4-like [Hydra vulgaris]|uniref:PiggyBac transposable element-derived protein 4-like n=1 Tax=Hydra vulgaris TaxID=6087 RepID=A0ABM4B0Z2_HYDVU